MAVVVFPDRADGFMALWDWQNEEMLGYCGRPGKEHDGERRSAKVREMVCEGSKSALPKRSS
jgi:hypothetical protein